MPDLPTFTNGGLLVLVLAATIALAVLIAAWRDRRRRCASCGLRPAHIQLGLLGPDRYCVPCAAHIVYDLTAAEQAEQDRDYP